MVRTRDASDPAGRQDHLTVGVPDGSQVLIVSDDPSADRLKTALETAGIASEIAKSMKTACECLRSSSRFQTVLTKPLVNDGSWRRLIDITNHYDLSLAVVLVTSNFDLSQRDEALEDGAFDILDASHEMPRVAEVVKRALWTACLKGAGPRPGAVNPSKAA